MKVNFYVNQYKKDKEDNAPFEVVITVNNTRAKFTLKHKVKYFIWNNKKQEFVFKDPTRLRNFEVLNVGSRQKENIESKYKVSDIATYEQVLKHLEIVKTKLYDAENKLIELGYAVDAQSIKDMYFGKIKGKQHSFTAYYTDFLETKKKRVGKDIVNDTYQKYETVLQHFKNFLQKKYKRDDIQLMEINSSMINAFDSYLLDDLRMGKNTIAGYMKKFKTVLSLAQQDTIIANNPMNSFKIKTERKDITYLTKEELSVIYHKEIENERLKKVKDLFIFACYTGLSFIDLSNFDTKKHLKKDKQGNPYIYRERTKTSVPSEIPLLQIPKEILEKYNYNLPVLSNQKYNAYLKEIQNICNINKTLHSHLCRHTCATLLLNSGVSLITVSHVLGHSTTKETEKTYAKLLPTTIMDEVLNVSDKLQL